MRKIALITTALLGLAFVEPTFAQPNQAGPQPGLPPGAGAGAVNAVPPRTSGQITTTAPMAAPMPMADMGAPRVRMSRHRRVRHSRIVHHRMRHHRHHTVAPAADAPAAQ